MLLWADTNYRKKWDDFLMLCIDLDTEAGCALYNAYHECVRTADQVTAAYIGTTSNESLDKHKRAFESLKVALTKFSIRAAITLETSVASPSATNANAASRNQADEIASKIASKIDQSSEKLKSHITAETDREIAAKAPNRFSEHKYDRSDTKDWTQKKAAQLLGISERQLRYYKKRPPDNHWPGWEDPIRLMQWMNQRDDRDKMAQAMSRALPYRENATERARRK